jgi:hypothetical protein
LAVSHHQTASSLFLSLSLCPFSISSFVCRYRVIK